MILWFGIPWIYIIYSLIFLTDSPYRTPISSAILQLQEGGKLHMLKEKWWKQRKGGGQCKVSNVLISSLKAIYSCKGKYSIKYSINFLLNVYFKNFWDFCAVSVCLLREKGETLSFKKTQLIILSFLPSKLRPYINSQSLKQT